MEPGNIVEYIDRRKIICAAVLEHKDKRLRVLSENDREVNLPANRLSHKCRMRIDPSQGRAKMVAALKEIADRREKLIDAVNIKELWEVLNTEQQWIDLSTMTEFCFPKDPTYDHESAIVRAFFKNRMYFKFYPDRFFPYSEEQVEKLAAERKEAERRSQMIQEGTRWLQVLMSNRDFNPDTQPYPGQNPH